MYDINEITEAFWLAIKENQAESMCPLTAITNKPAAGMVLPYGILEFKGAIQENDLPDTFKETYGRILLHIKAASKKEINFLEVSIRNISRVMVCNLPSCGAFISFRFLEGGKDKVASRGGYTHTLEGFFHTSHTA